MVFATEILLIFFIIGFQLYFFSLTYVRIKKLKELFPSFQLSETHIRTVQFDEDICEQIVIPDHQVDEFQNIVKATNAYLRKNRGSTDFSIIKNVAERVSESQESSVTTNIGLPLYIGLMGTFVGVIIGLGVLISKPEFGNAEIKAFILGVVIAMIGSFFGLVFTTINNSAVLKNAKAQRDRNKNNYYNFLQTELLPNLDNSLYVALDNLKINISNFNTIFSKNIESFDSTFGKKIDVLKSAVSDISQNIGVISEGNRIQKEFLTEIRKKGYVRMAEVSTEFFQKVTEAAPLLSGLIEKQAQFNSNVQNLNHFADKVSGLLNRITEFESGINQLGRDLRQSDLLGSEVLTLVRKHLNAIQQKEQLITDYSIKSTESVKQYLEDGIVRVESLKRKLELHFERAFDFDTEGNVLQKLNHLSEIDQRMALLVSQNASRKIDPELSEHLETIKNLLEEIKRNSIENEQETHTRFSDDTFFADISTPAEDVAVFGISFSDERVAFSDEKIDFDKIKNDVDGNSEVANVYDNEAALNEATSTSDDIEAAEKPVVQEEYIPVNVPVPTEKLEEIMPEKKKKKFLGISW